MTESDPDEADEERTADQTQYGGTEDEQPETSLDAETNEGADAPDEDEDEDESGGEDEDEDESGGEDEDEE